MRYVVAGLIAVALIVGMFVFAQQMHAQVEIWKAQDANLASFQLTAMDAADWWTRYWYVGSAVLLAVPLLIAAVLPRRQS